jgi:hypothetical protein
MTSKNYIRRGDVCLTKNQYAILCQLRDGLEAEQPLVKLEIKTKSDQRTLDSMQKDKDWIVSSTKIFEEVRYAITGRGLNILKAIEAPAKRAIPAPETCHRCKQNPRYVSPGGKRSAYCVECQKAYNRARHAAKGHGWRADKPCSCCKSAPRHVNKNGNRETYCVDCRRRKGLERKRSHYERAVARAQSENAPLCERCGKHPHLITGQTVYSICRDCFNAQRRANERKLKIQRLREIQQRLRGFKP